MLTIKLINTPEDLFEEMKKMNKDNSVTQFTVAGKGKFTLVYQEDAQTIEDEIESDIELKEMIRDSRKDYKKGKYKTTSELIDEVNKESFFK